jgi:hypothetical protein
MQQEIHRYDTIKRFHWQWEAGRVMRQIRKKRTGMVEEKQRGAHVRKRKHLHQKSGLRPELSFAAFSQESEKLVYRLAGCALKPCLSLEQRAFQKHNGLKCQTNSARLLRNIGIAILKKCPEMHKFIGIEKKQNNRRLHARALTRMQAPCHLEGLWNELVYGESIVVFSHGIKNEDCEC